MFEFTPPPRRVRLGTMQSTPPTTNSLPYLTTDLDGVGGDIKRYDEDFLVEEIPLYEASGQGTHTYFLLQKRGLPTLAAIRIIAAKLGVKTQDIGYAGLKDAHGITQQRFSVEHISPEHVSAMSLDHMKVLSVDRHTNKLKLGHLAGNRFCIKIRDTIPNPAEQAGQVVSILSDRGVPNYFGPQRFGVRGDNALIGSAVLRGDFDDAITRMLGQPQQEDNAQVSEARRLFDKGDHEAAAEQWPRKFAMQSRVCRAFVGGGDAKKAWRCVDHSLRRLLVSAVQSDLFNRVLAPRVDSIDQLLDGDVAWKHANGACFLVESAATEQPRCDEFEISPTGPLFGKKMKNPTGRPATTEQSVLKNSGVTEEQFRPGGGFKLDGARRPLRVPLAHAHLEDGHDDHGPYLQLSFELPPGSYATVVTREICKNA